MPLRKPFRPERGFRKPFRPQRGFTRPQQGHFRPMVERAWQAHCRANAVDPKSPGKRAWYETELESCTGHTSTSECDARADFELAMAHFESIVGDSIYWQLRLYGGQARRIIHEIRALSAQHDLDEQYAQAIARTAIGRHITSLESLTPEQLLTVLRALRIHTRRGRDGSPSRPNSDPSQSSSEQATETDPGKAQPSPSGDVPVACSEPEDDSNPF